MKIKSLVAGIILSAALVAPFAASALSIDDLQQQIKDLLARVASLQVQIKQQIASSSPVVANVTNTPRLCAILNRNLSRGKSGDDVRGLQEFLTSEGFLNATATGFFGPATASAVAKWQASEGVTSIGSFGPLSRERLKIRCGNSGNGLFSVTPQQGAAPLAVSFTYQGNEENGQHLIDFGDGASQKMDTRQIYCIRAPCISPSVANHTYTAPGIYTATVSYYIACFYSNPRCLMAQPAPITSTIVSVTGVSGGGTPVISAFSGPTLLGINEMGTWNITAADPENGTLKYSIMWGDEWTNADASNKALAPSAGIQQTTSFTHSYSRAGTYTVALTVTDATGKSARATATVQVSQTVCTADYAPVCGRPQGCANTCAPGMYCTMQCQLHEPQTYSSRCQMNNSNATFMHEGVCTGNEGYLQ